MLLLCNILKCLVSKPPFIGAFSYFHFQHLYLQTSLAMSWPSNHTVPIDASGCAVWTAWAHHQLLAGAVKGSQRAQNVSIKFPWQQKHLIYAKILVWPSFLYIFLNSSIGCLLGFFFGLFRFQVCFQDLQRLVQLATGFGPTLLPGWGSLCQYHKWIQMIPMQSILHLGKFARWNDTDSPHLCCQAPQLSHSASLNGSCSGPCNEWQRTWRRARCE